MKTVEKFEISISKVYENEVAIINRWTGEFANRKLKSMNKIKKVFKIFLNSKETMTFSHFPLHRIDELKSLLPKHRISTGC